MTVPIRHATAPQTPILTYHVVSDEVDERFARYAMRPRDLETQVAWLAGSGRAFLTVGRYVEALRAGAVPPHAVVLTFDDGFHDFLTDALPILRRHGATATLFVATAYLGGTSTWLAAEGEGGRAMLSEAEVREVAAAGIEIGGHSHTHPELDRLPPARMADEASTSRSILERALGAPVRTFAYPFGYHDRRVRRAVRDAGYTSACAVGHLSSRAADDPFALRRQIVARELPLPEFQRMVDRPPSAVERAVREVRELGAGLVRRARPPRRPAGSRAEATRP